MHLEKFTSLLLFTVPCKAITHWKGQNLNFQEKIFGLRKPVMFLKKNKQGIFLQTARI